MNYLRLLLLPFSYLYGLVVWLRNRLYDRGLLSQTSFDLPVLVVGNLEVGGTGKSPMIEYLIRLLRNKYKLAILSRGYGRKIPGYRVVSDSSSADQSGDEPLQFKQKFLDLTVAVSERRVTGVRELKDTHDAILLDDAFQHRALKPGFSMLLFDYNRIHQPRFFLPAGDYRDDFAERRRADILVVTKCPPNLSEESKAQIVTRLFVKGKSTPVLFASTKYGSLQPVYPRQLMLAGDTAENAISFDKNIHVLVITGIARPKPFIEYIESQTRQVEHIAFKDHHRFTARDLKQIENAFDRIPGQNKLMITTEKDMMRLTQGEFKEQTQAWPLYYIPIELIFIGQDGEAFDQRVLSFFEKGIIS